MEQFKFIYINECKTNFFISNKGRLFTINYNKQGKIHLIKPFLNNDCHMCVSLKFKGKNYYFTIHKLVATYFVPNNDNKPEIHHIDGNPLNNDYNNLMWVTKKDHAKLTSNLHQYDIRSGDNSPVCKYSDEQMKQVCKLLVENELTLKEISKVTGVPYATINLMRNNNTSRSNLKMEFDISHYNKFKNYKYNNELINKACKILESMHKEGYLNVNPTKCDKIIAEKLGINQSTIKALRLKKRHVDIIKKYNF